MKIKQNPPSVTSSSKVPFTWEKHHWISLLPKQQGWSATLLYGQVVELNFTKFIPTKPAPIRQPHPW